MAKKDRPAQPAGEGNGGGQGYNQATGVMDPPTQSQWQPQQQTGEPQSAPQPQQTSTPPAWQPPATQPPGYQQYDPMTAPPWRPDPQAQPKQEATAAPLAWQPPPPAGKTPTGVSALGAPRGIGTNATHFSGPIVSGGIPQTPVWRPRGSTPSEAPVPIGGSAVLTTTLVIDYSMGNFTVPVQFPAGSLITGFAAATVVAFGTPPTVSLGKTSGATDIATGPLPAPGAPVTFQAATGQLPLWDATSPERPFQAFLTVAGNTGGTAGLGVILIQFVRIPAKWSLPAK